MLFVIKLLYIEIELYESRYLFELWLGVYQYITHLYLNFRNHNWDDDVQLVEFNDKKLDLFQQDILLVK